MDAFLQSYGLWILLAGVFLAMHWFGMGCGGHRHAGSPPSEDERNRSDGATKRPAHSGHSGGCH